MKPKTPNSKLKTQKGRFVRLAALTAAAVLTTREGFRAMEPTEHVPPVDALKVPPPVGDKWPLVSVIVPARNEERNLPRLLPTLLRQHYPDYEVLVVDDQSTDATPSILASWAEKDGRLKVVEGRELPQDRGWRGKPYAMQQGVEQAHGEWLLFTDADTTHAPLSISSSMSYALANDVDLLTIFPHSELGTAAERIIMPVAFMGITTLYPPTRVNDPNSKVAIANGQYLLIRRRVYNAVGGIESVKDKIAEDLEFARVVKGAGYRLLIAEGTHLMSVRMYTSFDEIWEGWSKNTVLSFKGKPALALLAVSGVFSLTLMPVIAVGWAWRAWRNATLSGEKGECTSALWAVLLAAWSVVLPFVYRRRIDKNLGLSPAWTLTQPLGTLAMAAIMVSSLRRLLMGKGVTWKGRTYEVRET